MKSEAVASADLHPLWFQLYVSIGVSLSSFLLLLIEPSSISNLTVYGLMSAAMWVTANSAAMFAVKILGIATAQSTWGALIAIISFVSSLLFHDDPKNLPLACLGVFVLIMGIAILAYVSSKSTPSLRASSLATKPLLDVGPVPSKPPSKVRGGVTLRPRRAKRRTKEGLPLKVSIVVVHAGSSLRSLHALTRSHTLAHALTRWHTLSHALTRSQTLSHAPTRSQMLSHTHATALWRLLHRRHGRLRRNDLHPPPPRPLPLPLRPPNCRVLLLSGRVNPPRRPHLRPPRLPPRPPPLPLKSRLLPHRPPPPPKQPHILLAAYLPEVVHPPRAAHKQRALCDRIAYRLEGWESRQGRA